MPKRRRQTDLIGEARAGRGGVGGLSATGGSHKPASSDCSDVIPLVVLAYRFSNFRRKILSSIKTMIVPTVSLGKGNEGKSSRFSPHHSTFAKPTNGRIKIHQDGQSWSKEGTSDPVRPVRGAASSGKRASGKQRPGGWRVVILHLYPSKDAAHVP